MCLCGSENQKDRASFSPAQSFVSFFPVNITGCLGGFTLVAFSYPRQNKEITCVEFLPFAPAPAFAEEVVFLDVPVPPKYAVRPRAVDGVLQVALLWVGVVSLCDDILPI